MNNDELLKKYSAKYAVELYCFYGCAAHKLGYEKIAAFVALLKSSGEGSASSSPTRGFSGAVAVEELRASIDCIDRASTSFPKTTVQVVNTPPHTWESFYVAMENKGALSVGGRPLDHGRITHWETKTLPRRDGVEVEFHGVARFPRTMVDLADEFKRAGEAAERLGKTIDAVGDVVKVPPHWHVRLTVPAARSNQSIPPVRMLAGDKITFMGYRHTVELMEDECEHDGLIIFDVVLPFKPTMDAMVCVNAPRLGVSDRATIVSIH